MKNKILNSIIAILLLLGVGFVLYPTVGNYFTDQEAQNTIRGFKELTSETPSAFDEETLERLRSDVSAYNEEIFKNGQSGLMDPFFFETSAFDLSRYGVINGVAGYINIPKMNIELPIYLGATNEKMALGATSLGYTSIPIGGVNTNAVLAGHRGYGTAPFFRDIESLEQGDKIYVTNFWETLAYEVVEIKIILPTEIQEVRIQEGRDLITLLTCHPYTQNSQRYLVYAERVPFEGIEEVSSSNIGWLGIHSESQMLILAEKMAPLIVVGTCAVIVVLRVVFGRRKKRAE